MASFPADTIYDDSATFEVTDLQDALAAQLLATRQLPGGRAPETVTISGGQAIVTQCAAWIRSEGASSSDNLDNIVAPDLPDGSLILVLPYSMNEIITIRQQRGGAGQIQLAGDSTATAILDAPNKGVLLRKSGDDWQEVILRASELALRSQGSVEITASGTWTVPAGVKNVSMTIIGAGGGGGGGAGTNTDGSPGVAGRNGTAGGDTTVAGLPNGDLTGNGGAAGGGGGTDGRGGAPGLNSKRGDNAFGQSGGRATGGDSPVVGAFSSRGRGGNGGAGANGNVSFTGAGGGASGAPGNVTQLNSLVSVTPGSTLTITIGAGGSGGSAGTGTFSNGIAGQAGQDGYVRITY